MKKSRDTIKYPLGTVIPVLMLAVSIVCYLYFLNMSVVEVVRRSEQVETQRNLQAQIAELEAKYIDAEHAVAAEIVNLENYRTQTKKYFVFAKKDSLALRDD